MARTPLKNVRVDDQLWQRFGAAAEAIGTDRTKVLVGFMRAFVDAMDPRRARSSDRTTGDDLSP